MALHNSRNAWHMESGKCGGMIYVEIVNAETGQVQHRELKQEGKNYALFAKHLFAPLPCYDQQSKVFGFVSQAYVLREVVEAKNIKELAQQMLRATDYVEYRTPTPTRTPSVAWLAWREQLREVVRGNATEIPPEPERYNAP